MNKKILFLILFCISFVPVVAHGVTVDSIIEGVVDTTWKIAVGVVVIMWIVTGILFLVAQGDPAKLTSARKSLLFSIAGTAVVILAWSAMGLVKGAIGA